MRIFRCLRPHSGIDNEESSSVFSPILRPFFFFFFSILACWHISGTGGFCVLIKVRFQSERPITAIAFKLFEWRVSLHMRPKIRTIGESFVALRTHERSLSRMRPHMSLKKPRSAESLPTHIALVMKLVCQNMHSQRRHRHIRLSAVLTALG